MKPDMTTSDLRAWFKRVSNACCDVDATIELDNPFKSSSLNSLRGLSFDQLDIEVDELGNGYGTVETSPSITIEGPIREFQFHGRCIERVWSESYSYGVFHRGLKHGIWWTFTLDNKLRALIEYDHGKPIKSGLLVKSGSSCLIGTIQDDSKLQGKGVYLYPGFEYAISGDFVAGKLQNGRFAKVIGAKFSHSKIGVPEVILKFEANSQPIYYDPATSLRISKAPLLSDQFEDLSVFVEESGTLGAGEGLFAKKSFQSGDLIALFNGLKIFKTGRITKISAESEEWSDYRLTVDKDIDIDITEDLISLKTYCASLGHKACHSFEEKNAKFDNLYHPRFGEIMSIVALKHIPENSEILVNYNYDVDLAPLWYKELWKISKSKQNSP